MPSIGDLVANLKVDSRQFSKGFANAQKTLARTTKSLKTELDTFGMSRKQIDLYKASQLGATSAQKAAILSLHGQIEAKQKLATATEMAAKATEQARQRHEQFHQSIRGGIGSIATATLKLTAFAGAAAAMGAVAVGFKAVKLAADAEQTAISFEVLTGSAERATELIGLLRTMAAKTPFEFVDLAEGTKTLMQFGVATQDVLKDLSMLSNIASGNADRLGRLSLVYGQISSAGRLMGQDLLQLINVGFNPLNQISKRTGETMMELRDRMSAGLIPFSEVRQAFVDATSEGGLFYKMNEKQSKTLTGRWSTLKDEITFALISIGESLIKNMDLKGVTANITELASTFNQDWLPAVEKMIKLAPSLLNAFGQIGKGIGSVANALDKGLSKWERFTLAAAGLASGQSPEDMAAAFRDMKQVERERMVPKKPALATETEDSIFKPKRGPQTLDELFAKEARDKQEWQIKTLQPQAEKMLAGLIRDGIAAVGSGLKSLGPAAKDTGPMRDQVGVMEKNSAEAFEVMRANVSPGGKDKIQEKQLSEAQKQTKILGKLEKKMTGPEMAALQLKIMGIED